MAFGLATKISPQISEVPPPLKLSAIVQGSTIDNVTWEKFRGKVVVLEFWNTACVPCIQAIPHLNNLAAQFSHKPVVFLCISDDNADHLKQFLARNPINTWLALDAPLKPTETAFGVVGMPHTVIVDASGRIAAITHPALLDAQHLEEILAGKPSTLPTPKTSTEAAPVVPVSNSLPATVEVSIKGPFPQPEGAYGLTRWRSSNCVFEADKAPLQNALSIFFHMSPKLIFGETNLINGLYEISASAPPGKTDEMRRQFIEAAKRCLGIDLHSTTLEVSVYSMTLCATNAPGLKAVKKRAGGGGKTGGFFLGGVPMPSLARELEGLLDRPVIDSTGLDGFWAADLKWEMAPQELSSGSGPEPAKVIKAAREQLGLDLQLVRRTMPVMEIHTTHTDKY